MRSTLRARAWLAAMVPLALAVGLPARAGGRAPTTQMNVVVILTDDQSNDSLPNHDPSPMPYLQSLIDDPSGHWVRFARAFDNTSLCCPARATLLTGRYSHHTGVQNNGLGTNLDESATAAVWLHQAGYETGLVGKYLNLYPWDRGDYTPAGWDDWVAFKSPPLYFDYTLIDNGSEVSYGSRDRDYSTDVLAKKAVNFLAGVTPGKPFFLYFAPYGPHYNQDLVWVPAPRHAGAFSDMAPVHHADFNEADVTDKPAWVRALPLLTTSQRKQMDADREGEYETLLSVDDAVKSIMDELQAMGVLDNTVVIYLSDNGFSFGEHRWETKTCPYGECAATPFFIRYPTAVAGTDRQHLVSTVDLAPTIAEVAGITSTSAIDGHSLVNLALRNPTPWRRGLLMRWFGQPRGTDPEERQADDPSDVTPYWGVRTGDYLYVEYDTGEKELYDLAGRIGPKDPYADDNHADDPSYAGVQAQLAALLAKLKSG